MTPVQLLALFRDQTFDVAAPHLWSDDEVYRYFDIAQTEFARLTGGIRDNVTSSVCDITITANTNAVATSPKIIKVVLAKSATLGKIPVLSPTDYRAEALEAAGTLRYLVQGESENSLRPINVPTENMPVHLTVMRLPLVTISSVSTTFEIRDEYTQHLVYGAMELAYLKDDPETYNKQRSEKHGATFREKAAEAQVELSKRNHTAGVVAYGGL